MTQACLLRRAAVFVLLTVVASAASAQNWMRASNELAFFVGGGAGFAKHEADFCGQLAGVGLAGGTCNSRDNTWRAYAGYRFHRNMAVEVGYADLGRLSGTGVIGGVPSSAELRASAYDVTLVGIFPIGDDFSAYYRVGFARYKREATASGVLSGASATETEPTFAFGLRYDLLQNLGLRFEWQWYSRLNIDTLGASAQLSF